MKQKHRGHENIALLMTTSLFHGKTPIHGPLEVTFKNLLG